MKDTGNIPRLKKIEESVVWKDVCVLAEEMYALLVRFPDEERWLSAQKLRQSANDVMYFTATALGNTSPTGNEYDWSMVRKNLAALKTEYRFSGRQEWFKLDPEMMVRLDDIAKKIDAYVVEAYAQTESFNRREMNELRAKYELAQKTYKLKTSLGKKS